MHVTFFLNYTYIEKRKKKTPTLYIVHKHQHILENCPPFATKSDHGNANTRHEYLIESDRFSSDKICQTKSDSVTVT